MSSELFGWELLYHSIENEIKTKEDILVAFTHWCVLKCGFQFIGIGDSKTVSGTESRTEILTKGWNDGNDYHLRYLDNEKLYLLRASKTNGDLIFNLLRSQDLTIASCVFKVDDTVVGMKGPIESLIPTYSDVLSTLRRELLDPVFRKDTHAATGTQTQAIPASSDRHVPDPDPLRDFIPSPINTEPWLDPLRNPSAVGRGDLHPFLPGGGMLFDPFQRRTDPNRPHMPGGLPRGAVPPGARFDPIVPPNLGPGRPHRPGPDPDHLPPPGYDDMFM